MAKKVLLLAYATSFLVILFFWAKLAIPLFASLSASGIMLAFGRLCGLTAVFCVLTQLLLIGRIKWIERLWGHDKLAIMHRKNGRYILYLVLAHFLLILGSYSLDSNKNVAEQLINFFNYYDDTIWAFVALLLFVSIALMSIYIKKLKLKYETWYFIHLLTYLAILLAYLHQLKLGGSLSQKTFSYYWITLYVLVIANFAYFRFLTPIVNFLTFQFKVAKLVPGKGATSIYITGKNLQKFTREAGQFMIVRFLDKKRWWQAHPFSLSWGKDNEYLRLTVKASGDFTNEISGLSVGTKVVIDGPHGKFTLPKSETPQKVLFIAGGIGITPIRALLEDSAGSANCILLYSNKTYAEIALKDELDKLAKTHSFPIHYFYSEEKAVSKADLLGRIDKSAIGRLVPDVKSRQVYLCGPEGFMTSMIEALIELKVPKQNIHFEKFSFH